MAGHVLSVQGQGAVSLTNEDQLLLMPIARVRTAVESVRRAKEATKQAMAALVTPLQQLRTEYAILENTDNVLTEVIRTSEKQ